MSAGYARRGVLCGLAALPAVAGGAALAAAPESELIRLGRELRAAWDEHERIDKAYAGVSTVEIDPLWEAAHDAACAIVAKIEAIPATNLEELRVKALACSWCLSGDPFQDDTFYDGHGSPTTDFRLASAVLRDLLAIPSA